jgi:TetR/AcrR family transcriptional repressor of nem operon
MQEAGLTHGAFYAHFNNKDELAAAAFRFALLDNRPRWMGQARKESWPGRLVRLANAIWRWRIATIWPTVVR